MENVDGVQDVFCGTETVVHMKRGSAPLATEAIEGVFDEFEIEYESVERDDSAML